MKLIATILTLIALSLGAPVLHGTNLVTNGDFADGLNGWGLLNVNEGEAAANPKAFIGDVGTIDGVLVLHGLNNGATGGGVEQMVAIGTADTYTFTFRYGYTNIGGYGTASISYRDAAGDPIAGPWFQRSWDWTTEPDPNPADTVYSNSSWSDEHLLRGMSVTLTRGTAPSGNSNIVPQNAAYAYISLKAHYNCYRTYWDDISLTAVDTIDYTVDASGGTDFYPAVRGQNVKASGTTDIEAWYNGRTLELSDGSSIRGVAGGLEADTYNWKDRTGRDVGHSTLGYKGRSTLRFLQDAQDFNCEPLITVNCRGIGTGVGSAWQQTDTSIATLAQLAADWVRYVNHIVPNYRLGDPVSGRDASILASMDWSSTDPGNPFAPSYSKLLSAADPNYADGVPTVTYWEIGNEPKAPIGTVLPTLPVAQYVANYKAIANAMIAEDPTIKVGPCFTNPVWEEEYYDALLADPCARVDFISYHTYQNQVYSSYAANLADLTDYLDDSIKIGLEYNKGLNLGKLTEHGRAPVELLTSEYNPAGISTIRDESIYQAHALACAEYVFTYAEMRHRMCQYWAWPIHWDNEADLPVAKMFRQLSNYMGSVLVDSYVGDNVRVYVTKADDSTELAVWALNFSETQDELFTVDLQDVPAGVNTIRRYVLADRVGITSLLSYNSSPSAGDDRNVGWRAFDMTDCATDALQLDLPAATITVVVLSLDMPTYCGHEFTTYFAQDLNRDCRVDMIDLSVLLSEWLQCSDPANLDCDQYLPVQ